MMARARRGVCILLGLVSLGLTCAMGGTASAADDAEEVATYAVQRRLFREGLELNVGVGALPLNAFYKGFVVEGTVTYHFTTTWGWEIAQGSYVFAQSSTGLENQLVNDFDVQ